MSKHDKNIVEAYIEFNKQLIILISGLPGCGKVTVAKKVSDLFKLSFLDEIDYFKKDNNEKVKLSDGKIEKDVTNWYTDNAINWDKLNEDVTNLKSNGIVLSGISFPADKITFKPDYHLHLNISKQQCIDKRLKFLERYTDTEFMEKTVMNQLIYPYYIDVTKRSKINKFVNINDIDDEKVFDNVFTVLIGFIQEYHDKRHQKLLSGATIRRTVASTVVHAGR